MSARLVRSMYNITPAQREGVVTIGNFDGVHLGHQALIAEVIAKARDFQGPSVVITFEPHPFEFFSREHVTIPRITRLREKFYALSSCGVDNVVILPFNQPLADLSARDFVTEILYGALQPKAIMIGDDFRFGRERQGDLSLLQSMGKDLGFSVSTLPTVMVNGERVSSTRVRKALSDGNHELVEQLLGHPYSMLGRVGRGDQLGRRLGFPTANIFLHRKLTPIWGVYIVYMHGITNDPLPGVANVGIRPTVNGTRILLEVHLLDFNQDIYGRYVEVEFCKKLREEVRYPTLDLLKEQIAHDVDDARDYFKKQGVL